MNLIEQAVILAGGQGIRLRPLTLTTPKPMIKIHGKPFLEYIIENLKKNKIKEIVILTGYLHEEIEKYFRNGDRFGLRIKYSYSPIEDETGARIFKAKKLIDDTFLLLYGDNFWPLDLATLWNFYLNKKKEALVSIYSNLDNYTRNNIYVNQEGLVELYDKSGKNANMNGVDIGFFILNKKVIDLLPEKNISFEETIIPELIRKKQLAGYLTNHKYYGLSNLSRIPAIEEFLTAKKVVFLDRDGVINKKAPRGEYITSWNEFKFLPKVKDALLLLKKKKFKIFVISNQAGIARRMVSRRKVDEINKKMLEDLEKIGVNIEDIFTCPHGWDEKCFCRKPNPGMFFQAASKYSINLFESYCVGDDDRDIIAGKSAGCKTILIGDKKINNFSKEKSPDRIFRDLYNAAIKL